MRPLLLLVGKDLRTLWRSPALLTILCLYPVLISALVGLVAGYANARPNVALVDLDHVPPVVKIGSRNFHFQNLLQRVRKDAHIVPMSESQAEDALRRGKVVGVITIPPGFVEELKSMRLSPTLQLETSSAVFEAVRKALTCSTVGFRGSVASRRCARAIPMMSIGCPSTFPLPPRCSIAA